MRILINGDQVSKPQGTGLSSYSRSLARVLSDLGHEVLWLSGAQASRKPDPLVDATLVVDEREDLRGPRAYLQTALNMTAGLLTRATTARRIRDDMFIEQPPNAPPQKSTLLAPNVFVSSHYRHMMRRKFTEVLVEEPVDILHLTSPLPIMMKGARTALTIHDLVPIRLPYTTQDNKQEFIERVRSGLKYADLIVTVSEASKRDIIGIMGVDSTRVFVTWQSSDIEPLSLEERSRLPRTLARFGLEEEGYGLFVGAIEPKKNISRMIDAFLDAHATMPLVLVGPKAWKWRNEIGAVDNKLGAASRQRLRLVGHIPRDDLRFLYAGARALIFPSLHEGFGLPALEAMRMGCAVVASDRGGLGEVCGSAAINVNPLDRADMSRGIAQVLNSESRRADLIAAGRVQAEKFSASNYEARLAEAYDKLR